MKFLHYFVFSGLLTGCTLPLLNAETPVENISQTHDITPRTKGSTLEITPRTKGSTYLVGSIELPTNLNQNREFMVEFRQNNLLLQNHSTPTDDNGTFKIELSYDPSLPVYIEARSVKQPTMVLMAETYLGELNKNHHRKLDIQSTSAVYLSRYLKLASQTPDFLMQSPEILEPINEMIVSYFQDSSSEEAPQSMDNMPAMQKSLEKARIMWTKLQNQR